MYNGVGLQTARGSGTSGYVQRNLSHTLPGQKAKLQDYGKILQQLKDAPQPLPKPPNQELINHEKRRKIEAQLFTMAKRLRESSGCSLSEAQIKEEVAKERTKLLADVKGRQTMDLKDKHQAAFAKERHMDQLKSALNISDKFEDGAAFDLELQERKREKRLAEKDQQRKEVKRARKEAKKEKQRLELQRQLLAVQQTVQDAEKERDEDAKMKPSEEEAAKIVAAAPEKTRKRSISSSSSVKREKSKRPVEKTSRRSRSRSLSSDSDKPRRRNRSPEAAEPKPKSSRPKHRRHRSSSSSSSDRDRRRKNKRRSPSQSSHSSSSSLD